MVKREMIIIKQQAVYRRIVAWVPLVDVDLAICQQHFKRLMLLIQIAKTQQGQILLHVVAVWIKLRLV